jgi:hypothetical protein
MNTKTETCTADIVVKNMSIWELYDRFGRKDCTRVRLVGWPHKDAYSCASSIKSFLDRNIIRTIKVKVRKGEVYLERVEN